MAKELDTAVEAFRTRPLDAGRYTFMAADGLVLKVREQGRVVNVHALIAVGVNAEGYREILGVDVTTAEDGAGWLTFLRSLTARGLSGVKLVTSDAHAGLINAIGATLPGASWQRCRTHYATNLMAVTPKSSWPWVRTLLHSVFDQPDAESVGLNMIGSSTRSPTSSRRSPPTSTMPAPSFWRSPPSPDRSGARSGQTTPRNGSTRKSVGAPMSSVSSPTAQHSSASSERYSPTTRRMGRITPLPRPRRPQQIPSRPGLTNTTGGHPGGTDRLNQPVEESHDDDLHHAPGLDPPQGPNRRVHVRRFALHPTAVLTGRISPRGPNMSTLPRK